jgi:hypothetical protein
VVECQRGLRVRRSSSSNGRDTISPTVFSVTSPPKTRDVRPRARLCGAGDLSADPTSLQRTSW